MHHKSYDGQHLTVGQKVYQIQIEKGTIYTVIEFEVTHLVGADMIKIQHVGPTGQTKSKHVRSNQVCVDPTVLLKENIEALKKHLVILPTIIDDLETNLLDTTGGYIVRSTKLNEGNDQITI